MHVERDARSGEYWRSKYLHLVKLLPPAVSSRRVVSYACRKRYYSGRVPEVEIPMSGEIADTGGKCWESG